jgi:Peptide N-acetyl-beta-D-glucosaminyl asparaginase amidase A
MIRLPLRKVSKVLIACAIAGTALFSAGQTRTAPSTPQIGSPNTVTADPPISRPATQPCTVQLFSDFMFDNNYNVNPFSYTPPADCPGPWQKVVFQADITVPAGRQFDRTANVWIGGVNLFFGTTSEPQATVTRSWHVESDVTDYSSVFTVAQPGGVFLGNTVTDVYTSILSASASLQFYPLAHHQPAPRSADVVLPMSAGPNGGSVYLHTPSEPNTLSFVPPTNIERAYLDIIAQSQIGDEFWYTCVPNNVAGELETCGSTAFREVEVTVDGKPAGVAPVYPWIYTGGIDPYLWRPIPGVEALNFSPYRVDLTPFAGLLNDGNQHQVAFTVFNNGNYFATAGALLLYLDAQSNQVTGGVTKNTIGAPQPSVNENLSTAADGTVTGTVSVTSSRNFEVAGFVKTSHGKIQTDIQQNINFSSVQTFEVNASSATGLPDIQNVKQDTTVSSSTSRYGEGPQENTFVHAEYPLTLDFSLVANANGSFSQATSINQQLTRVELDSIGDHPVSFSYLSRSTTPQDTLLFDSSFNLTGTQGQSSAQTYLC